MGYLALHILSSACFGLIVKWAEWRHRNVVAVGMVNYIVASLISAMAALMSGQTYFSARTPYLALFGGVTYIASYLWLVPAVRDAGVAVAMAVLRLGLALLPAAFAVAFWHERPVPAQIAGLLLTCVALPMASLGGQMPERPVARASWTTLFWLFVSSGGCGLAAKAFQEMGQPSQRCVYLALLFGTAAVINIAAVRWSQWKAGTVTSPTSLTPCVSRADVPFGAVLGGVNVIGNWFLLLALKSVPATIAFPVSSSSSVLLITLFAFVVWHERRSVVGNLGMGLAVVALVLVNLRL